MRGSGHIVDGEGLGSLLPVLLGVRQLLLYETRLIFQGGRRNLSELVDMIQGGRRNLSEVVDMFQGGRRNLPDMVDMFGLERGNMVDMDKLHFLGE